MKTHPAFVTILTMATIAVSLIPAAHADLQGNGPADMGYMQAMRSMDHSMQSMQATGDADKDFVMMMIPHHQAAIDMAKVELQYGKDPLLQEMARKIIKAQDDEITEMKAWQTKHGD